MSHSGVYNIIDYGAVGDGLVKDTRSIQAAIDACAVAGGGTVYVPPGAYLTGTIQLKSRINLQLSAGATLLGSPDRQDYPSELGTINTDHDGSEISDWSGNAGPEHLIVAKGESDVSISGGGTIDGQGKRFFVLRGPEEEGRAFKAPAWRPFRMIAFVDCRNVTISDIRLLDGTGFHLWFAACDRVRVTGIRIDGNYWGPNTDGIDIDCSQNVIVSGCDISCGDDAIALKSGNKRFPGRDVPCENVVVSDCTLTTSVNGIRVGYEGDGPIRNCVFGNLTVTNSRNGINILVPYHPDYGIHHGPAIENVHFHDMVFDVCQAIFINVAKQASPPGCVRNVSFANILARAKQGCFIGGSGSVPLENISFSHIGLTLTGDMDEELAVVPDPYVIWGDWKKRGIPYGFYCRTVRGLSFHQVRVDRRQATGSWLHELECVDVSGLDDGGLSRE